MKPGRDTAQAAVWIADEDNPAKIAWWKNGECARRLQESADQYGVTLGPVSFYELQPGEGQAGHPPEGARGSNMRLLVGEAEVVGFKAVAPVRQSFIADLDPKDLARLRSITITAALPKLITEAEADAIIENFGPTVAERVLKEAVDANR